MSDLTINLEFDAAAQAAPSSFRTALQTAANMLDAAIRVKTPITVNLTVQYNENGIGAGSANAKPSTGLFEPYSTVRSKLLANAAPGDTNFNALPTGSSIQGQSAVKVWNAQLKALGLLAGNNAAIDGTSDFSSSIPQNSLVGVGIHELSHALGRVTYGPQPDIFDLFRFTSTGTRLFDNGNTAPAAYFSVDGGNTPVADYGQNNDPSDFLNPPDSNLTPNDPFNEFYDLGGSTLQSLTSIDLTQLDVLGFNTSSTLFASPVLALSAFGSNPSSGWFSQDQYPRALADVNGDGKDDIVGFGSAGMYESLATGNGQFTAPSLVLSAFGSNPSSGWTSQNLYPRELADVNGDGKADIVGFGSQGVYVDLAIGGGNFGAPFLALSALGSDPNTGGGWTSQDHYPRLIGDVTGDGRSDIVAFGAQGVYVATANANGTFQAPNLVLPAFGSDPSAGGWTSQNLFPFALADVNGATRNGHPLDDIVAFASDGVYVALADANGDGKFQAPFLALSGFGTNQGWTSQDAFPRELADVNGDGGADVVGFGSAGAWVATGNADGTFSSPVLALNQFGSSASAGGWTSFDAYPRLVGDVTGDHHADLVGFASNGTYVAFA